MNEQCGETALKANTMLGYINRSLVCNTWDVLFFMLLFSFTALGLLSQIFFGNLQLSGGKKKLKKSTITPLINHKASSLMAYGL